MAALGKGTNLPLALLYPDQECHFHQLPLLPYLVAVDGQVFGFGLMGVIINDTPDGALCLVSGTESPCMFIYIYMHTHRCVQMSVIWIHAYTYLYICIIYTYTYTNTNTYAYTHTYTLCVDIHIRGSIRMFFHIYVMHDVLGLMRTSVQYFSGFGRFKCNGSSADDEWSVTQMPEQMAI